MATRRVALDPGYLPTSGPAHGTSLLVAIAAEHLRLVSDDDAECYDRALHAARDGIEVPAIVLRHRLQTDTHGLDRSRHRLLGEHGTVVAELDVHGAPIPQLLGTVLAAATLPASARPAMIRALRDVVAGRRVVAPSVVLRHLTHGHPAFRPPPAGVRIQPGAPPYEQGWTGVSSDIRWAMEVLGFVATDEPGRDEVNRRYRALLRDAHPDHGGAGDAAAERIAELGEARQILLVDEPPATNDASVGSA